VSLGGAWPESGEGRVEWGGEWLWRRSYVERGQKSKVEARGCQMRAKVGVIYVFNWVWALSSYSWGTIRRARAGRRDKGAKGGIRVVFKLVATAGSDMRRQEGEARMMGVGDKSRRKTRGGF